MIKLNTPYAVESHIFSVSYNKAEGGYCIYKDYKSVGICFKRLPSARNYCKYLMEKEIANDASYSCKPVERV